MDVEKINAFCPNCGSETHHEILKKYEQTQPHDYECHVESDYCIIKCCGCDNVSFLYIFKDYEDIFVDDTTGNEVCRTEREQYPRFVNGYRGFKEKGYFPEIIQKIYDETLDALKNENLILTGIGLRAIIEAVTKNEKIEGKNLSVRINNLFRKGFLSKKDADRLHAVRFLGNDSAHEIVAYDKSKVILCFEIIENVLKSLYVLDKKSEFFLDVPIKNYSEFLSLVRSKLKYAPYTDTSHDFTIRSLLGKDIRKVLDNLNQYEQRLINDINASKFQELTISNRNNEERDGKVVYYKSVLNITSETKSRTQLT